MSEEELAIWIDILQSFGMMQPDRCFEFLECLEGDILSEEEIGEIKEAFRND